MNKYAIIKIGHTQYKIEEGKEYEVPKFQAEPGEKFEVSEVLAIGEGENLVFGDPFVANAKVSLNIIVQAKGEKVRTAVFKAKSRYRRTWGFRKRVTKFKVEKIITK